VVAATGGVDSVALDGQGRDKVVVVGEGIDPVKLTCALRKKVGAADLLQVGEANPPAAVPSVPPVTNIVHYHPAGYSCQWHVRQLGTAWQSETPPAPQRRDK